jgi:hypothetical protein
MVAATGGDGGALAAEPGTPGPGDGDAGGVNAPARHGSVGAIRRGGEGRRRPTAKSM